MKKILLLFALFITPETYAQLLPLSTGYRLEVRPTNVVIGEKVFASYEAPLFSFTLTDWIGLYAIDAADGNPVNRDAAFVYKGTRSFETVATGLFNVRYFSELTRVAVSPTIRVFPIVGDRMKIVNYPGKGGVIAVLSDSLGTDYRVAPGEGWVSILEAESGFPIRNFSVVGSTTAGGFTRLPEALGVRPQIVVILLGGNNAIQDLPEQSTFADLREIIRRVREAGAVPILVGVPGGIDARESLIYDRFADNFNALWQETGVTYVPDILDDIASRPIVFTSMDLVHPNAAGHRRIAERMVKVIRELYVPPPWLSLSTTERGIWLEWSSVANATYIVYEAQSVMGPWSAIATVPARGARTALELENKGSRFYKVSR